MNRFEENAWNTEANSGASYWNHQIIYIWVTDKEGLKKDLKFKMSIWNFDFQYCIQKKQYPSLSERTQFCREREREREKERERRKEKEENKNNK